MLSSTLTPQWLCQLRVSVTTTCSVHACVCANTVSRSVCCVTTLHRQGSPERDRGAKGPDKLFKKIKANKLGAAEPRTVR
jgi:hypothetical protein